MVNRDVKHNMVGLDNAASYKCIIHWSDLRIFATDLRRLPPIPHVTNSPYTGLPTLNLSAHAESDRLGSMKDWTPRPCTE